MRGVLAGLADWSQASLETAANAYAAEHAQGKIGAVAQPLRIGVSGGTVSPPIWDTLVLVGRDSALARIDRSILWAAGLR
jgi:glutamyl-tRNA synthetase